jgi:hypothetical protein
MADSSTWLSPSLLHTKLVDSFITDEQLVYWYRITPSSINCDTTDTTMGPANNDSGNYFNGKPYGYQAMQDNVFVVSLLKSPGTVIINSGGTAYTFDAPTGAAAIEVPFNAGYKSFVLNRNGSDVLSATSLKVIQDTCPCGIYNWNACVGTVPDAPTDSLQTDGLQNFANGLKVACAPTPSLPATPPDVTPASTTITIAAAPTGHI